MKQTIGVGIAGFSAGALNGLFGAGGGMILVPLLNILTDIDDRHIFATSVSIMLPICITSLLFGTSWDGFSLREALPYLLGSAVGGVISGLFGKKIPGLWLHRVFGILILWGGIRYIC